MSPGDIQECLETFLVIPTGNVFWHLGGGDQGYYQTPEERRQPHNQDLTRPMVHGAEAEKPCSSLASSHSLGSTSFISAQSAADPCFCKNVIEINYAFECVNPMPNSCKTLTLALNFCVV